LSTLLSLPAWPVPTLPVEGRAERFPVRRIFCIGRNYADHVREMGGDPNRGSPIFFMKPADALVTDGQPVPYPKATEDLHHEVELVTVLGQDRRPWGFAVGLDMTRRDLQARAKAAAAPWEVAKAFEGSAVVGALRPAAEWPGPRRQLLLLRVNGTLRQQSPLDHMIWSLEEILAELGALFTLKPGDLIFTGTPAGVAALRRGDRLEASVEGLPVLDTVVV
jgi:fumarylpyruvate hydrolase